MTKQDEYAKALKEYAKQVDRDDEIYISSILQEKLGADQHIMLIEEKMYSKSQKGFERLEKEFSLLEKVDLIDYWNIVENGRTNKTR